jgi:septum formation protein
VRLILASASARRRELLTAAGVRFDVDGVAVDESRHDGERAAAYATRVARAKAQAAQARHPDAVVLSADTVVVIDADAAGSGGEVVLGKPTGEADAAAMLRRLSGRDHVVLTAVTVMAPGGEWSVLESTRVWMAPLTEDDIAAYVRTGEPADKAGGYAIQGLASRFVTRIEGSYANVVGLPVAAVLQILTMAGVEGVRFDGEPAGRPAGLG